MDDITIVTAFFDIGRSNYEAIPRTNEKYINWFEHWARIRNRLIVYCGNQLIADKAREIRRNFNLEEKTEIIIFENLQTIEEDLYTRLARVGKDYYFKNFRLIKNATSNIPEYDLINYLKSYFMNDAQKRFNLTTQVAWIDFGFNHGGELYPYPEDYDFEWSYDFGDKVTLFFLAPLDERPIFEIVRTLKPDCIMGCMFISPPNLVEKLWVTFLQSALELTDVGLLDDDQLVLLMSYRQNPTIFRLVESDWFLPLKTFGGPHLRTVSNSFLGKKILRNIKQYLSKRIRIIRYLIGNYKVLIKQKGI